MQHTKFRVAGRVHWVSPKKLIAVEVEEEVVVEVEEVEPWVVGQHSS